MSALPLFECCVRVLRYGAIKPPKHAAVTLGAQDEAGFWLLCTAAEIRDASAASSDDVR
jgi:hypothetical protein